MGSPFLGITVMDMDLDMVTVIGMKALAPDLGLVPGLVSEPILRPWLHFKIMFHN
jgi:hypothetical protein